MSVIVTRLNGAAAPQRWTELRQVVALAHYQRIRQHLLAAGRVVVGNLLITIAYEG